MLFSPQAITFHLVESAAELENEEDKCFNPEFTHQQFGDTQQIKGYKGLEVHLWMCAKDFRTYMDVRYEKKHLKPEHDVEEILAADFPAGLESDRAAFEAHLSAASFDPSALGAVIASHTLRDGAPLDIRRACLPEASPELRALHARLEPLLLFFIDAASSIDQEDPLWFIHTAVRTCPKTGESRVVAFATLYNFFAYPDRTRTRLSQIFVLPPYQGLGIGYRLVESVNAQCAADPECLELTYEDPTDDLNRIRDLLDCRRLLATDWFLPAVRGAVTGAQAALGPGGAAEAARALALPAAVLARARAELRISGLQMARVWELCLFATHEVRGGAALRGAAVEAMARRMKCDETQRKQQIARGKRIVPLTESAKSDDWILRKEGRKRGAAAAVPAPVGDAGPSTSGGAGEPVAAAAPESGEYVEPEDVVRVRAVLLQERLTDRMRELERSAGAVGEEIEEALAREAQRVPGTAV